MSRRIVVLAALPLIAWGVTSGMTAQGRLSDPRGYWLVDAKVSLDVRGAGFVRPRRIFFIVVDGLRADRARTMSSTARLGRAGVCVDTFVPVPTVSRPVYAALSTGVGAARTGVRGNEGGTACGAESIWQVAREANLTVVGWSELSWWRDLFPAGFDHYEVGSVNENLPVLAATGGGELVLVHPVYVDEAAHDHGAASSAYSDAVRRVDRELEGLLDRVDLATDLVLLTSDHGHIDAGGHGGAQPEVTHVWTCVAGPHVPAGVTVRAEPRPTDLTLLIATLAGLRDPRHAEAPSAGAEALFEALTMDPPTREAVRRERASRRETQLRFLEQQLGATDPPASWALFEDRERRSQHVRGLVGLLAAGVLLFVFVRRRARTLLWLAAVIAAHVMAYVFVRGSFDATSLNQRGEWIAVSLTIGLCVAAAGAYAHWRIFHDLTRMRTDVVLVATIGLAADLIHALTFGWPVGYPMPGPALLFFPFFVAIFTTTHAAVALVTAMLARIGSP